MDIAVISALFGALIGGLCTGVITWLTVRTNRKDLINGVLQGIHAEIETLWLIYRIKFKDAFDEFEKKSLRENFYVTKKYPLYLHERYFVVYDSNCSRIGQIPDDKLRGDIVTGYLRARELLDAYLHNNELLRDLDHSKRQQQKVTTNEYDADVKSVEDALIKHAKYIADVHRKVKEFYETVRVQIAAHNKSNLVRQRRSLPETPDTSLR